MKSNFFTRGIAPGWGCSKKQKNKTETEIKPKTDAMITQEKAMPMVSVQTGKSRRQSFGIGDAMISLQGSETRMYDSIRESVPLIDASINKIIRLVGGFTVSSDNREADAELKRFCAEVKVGACGRSMNQFIYGYMNDLLTYGNAVGEMIPFSDGDGVGALYNASLENISIRQRENPLIVDLFVYPDGIRPEPIRKQERILFSALNPPSGEIKGRSILEGLQFVTNVLMKIYDSVGQNFERMGNLRFAVTYKPNGDNVDRAYAREIAQNMASQWAETMRDSDRIRDFIAVGDVDIKVIGADSQMMDTQVPVRQMLEQIIAKLGLPPFILGLSWSTTERMSKQQADILTSELESYRNLLTPVIRRICGYHLGLKGISGKTDVAWSNISITDEVEQARAKLLRAQAAQVGEKGEKIQFEETLI